MPESRPTPTSPEEPYGEAYYRTGNYHDYLERGPKYAALVEEMLSWLDTQGVPRDTIILDYGCGVGHLVAGIWEHGGAAFGYDTSPWAAYRAICTVSPPLIACHPSQLDGLEWDIMVALDVFEHMNLSEVLDTLRRTSPAFLAVRIPVSKIDGRPYVLPCSERDPTHRLRLTKASWAAVFKAAGYVEVARPALKHWWDSEGVYCALFRRES